MAAKKDKVAVLITLRAGGTLDVPDDVTCQPDNELIFVFVNTEPSGSPDRFVSIDTADTIFREDFGSAGPPKADPFANPGRKWAKLKAGEVDTIRHTLLPKGNFGKGKALLYTSYKYTVVSADNQSGTTNPRPLDPVFVITPP